MANTSNASASILTYGNVLAGASASISAKATFTVSATIFVNGARINESFKRGNLLSNSAATTRIHIHTLNVDQSVT